MTKLDSTMTIGVKLKGGLLERIPWMTLGTYIFTAAFLLATVMGELPPKYGVPAAAAVKVAGLLGKAFYELAQRPQGPTLQAMVDEAAAAAAARYAPTSAGVKKRAGQKGEVSLSGALGLAVVIVVVVWALPRLLGCVG